MTVSLKDQDQMDDEEDTDSNESENTDAGLRPYMKLSKTTSQTSVYALFTDMTRRVFINESSYFTWENDFDPVELIVTDSLQSYKLIGLMLPKDEVVLVKIQSSPNVYFLEENPEDEFRPILRWISSETIAKKLFGSSWADYVVDIAPTFFTKFQLSDALLTEADTESIDVSLMKKREELSI